MELLTIESSKDLCSDKTPELDFLAGLLQDASHFRALIAIWACSGYGAERADTTAACSDIHAFGLQFTILQHGHTEAPQAPSCQCTTPNEGCGTNFRPSTATIASRIYKAHSPPASRGHATTFSNTIAWWVRPLDHAQVHACGEEASMTAMATCEQSLLLTRTQDPWTKFILEGMLSKLVLMQALQTFIKSSERFRCQNDRCCGRVV
ncbi:uncharacterized protein K489DRAFT_372788 [Dissoconium aciculare CBS 342.82]|jgi:hypothetical protein|uniref:Uncharacterized protein n=1 Tax=Dissoconium aciculare CBS 342.82 TaxID=1314786 RepID=A0A6J3LWZ3_9PEZI|nr:uncharacterized protein K489DRAFT_372788 [Dissoconium aciculare CBS 342.82]KAF1820275.1 hypothetical protein K489DRAFT_372788 [Dissoconium aciculare CBS 342.82]